MFSEGRIPLLVIGVVAGLGVISIIGLFLYGAYAGIGSSIVINNHFINTIYGYE